MKFEFMDLKAATLIQWEAILNGNAEDHRCHIEALPAALTLTIQMVDQFSQTGPSPRSEDFVSENLELFARAFECSRASANRGEALDIRDTQSFDALMIAACEWYKQFERDEE